MTRPFLAYWRVHDENYREREVYTDKKYKKRKMESKKSSIEQLLFNKPFINKFPNKLAKAFSRKRN